MGRVDDPEGFLIYWIDRVHDSRIGGRSEQVAANESFNDKFEERSAFGYLG